MVTLRDRATVGFLGALALVLLTATPALAQGAEVGLVVGALLGGELDFGDDELETLEASFDDSPVYGGRIGVYGHPWGLEGSLVVSPSGLSGEALGPSGIGDARVVYVEGNVLLIPIPGPVSPFATGGVGLHSFSFEEAGIDVSSHELGFNYGGGIKATLGSVGVRVDVRDHVTPLDAGDLPPPLVEILTADGEQTLHNWEISGGIAFRF